MNKNILTKFIQKYNLSGNVESVKWRSKNKKLSTSFVTEDKTLLGMVNLNNFDFNNCEIGINDTAQLNKLLNILEDDVSLSLTELNNKAVSLKVKNGKISFNYPLTDLSVIGDPPALKHIPNFNTKIKIDNEFINIFIKGKNALSEVDTFTIISDGDDLNVVIGHSSINSNRINIPVNVIENNLTENVTFNASIFKDILVSNKECSSAVFEISNEGLSKINFKIDDYDSTYYMVAIQGNN
tara:strand:+ start:3917 stop:4636 length:720 start_codon:yes stop_codon:yes gene_type:complete